MTETAETGQPGGAGQQMTGRILAINAGSSSIKFAVFGPRMTRHWHGQLEGMGRAPCLYASSGPGEPATLQDWTAEPSATTDELIESFKVWLDARLQDETLAAIGHRVAMGGMSHAAPVRITDSVLEDLRRLIPMAPLHQPRNIELIESFAKARPGLPQFACFDTDFHRTMPPLARLYGLPRELHEAGARRYGYHGLSYEYIASVLPGLDARAASGRTIIAHLGSGASLCALKAGKSIATTMGFSPLSGLVMGTRPGDLDPGLMIWLQRERGLSLDALESLLYRQSGLKGISGSDSDMRDLLASDDPAARQAIAFFVYRAAAEIGALTATLGGLDALVFTAGIGEHAAEIRRRICEASAWLGIAIDDSANTAHAPRIDADASRIAVHIIPTDEELMVATHTRELLRAGG